MGRIGAMLLLVAVAAAQEDPAVARLRDDDPAVRAAAARELGAQGAASAVPALVDAVYDPRDEVARAAIRALGSLGPAARDARPYLVDRAMGRADFDPLVARMLVRIGAPDAEPPLVAWLHGRGAVPVTCGTLADLDSAALRPHLMAALADPSPIVAAQAAERLSRLAQADAEVVQALTALLDHPAACVRWHAGAALSYSPLAAEAWAAMLANEDVRRRRFAARLFRGPAAVPHLRRALADPDARVRAGAAIGITAPAMREDPTLIEDLARAIDRDPQLVRSTLLWSVGPAAGPAVPALARCLASPDPRVRSAACMNLARIGGPAEPAAVALALAAFDESEITTMEACRALQSVGPGGREAAPYLAEMCDASPSRAQFARPALAAIGVGAPLPPLPDASELPALRARLGDADALAAGRAAFAIGRLAPTDAETLAALRAALGHASGYARMHAAFALQRIGTAALPTIAAAAKEGRAVTLPLLQAFAFAAPEQVLPLLPPLLASEDPYVRGEAARTAGILGARAHENVPALLACLEAADTGVVAPAAWALGRMGPDGVAAVPRLASLVGATDDAQVDWNAITALGELGAAAAPAVPGIVDAALTPHGNLLQPALEALVRIGPRGHAGLVEIVRRGNGAARMFVLETLGRNDLAPPGLGEALQEAVADPDPRVQLAVVLALSRLGLQVAPSPEALAALLANLDTRATDIVRAIAGATSIPALLAATQHENVRVRQQAWYILWLKEPDAFTADDRAAALPLLLDALGDLQTRAMAARVLRSVPLAGVDRRLLHALIGRPSVHDEIKRALVPLGARAVPGLIEALADKDSGVRIGAAFALLWLGPEAAPAIPALRKAARKEPRISTYVSAIVATRDYEAIASLFADPKMPDHKMLGRALVEGGEETLPWLDRLRHHESTAVRCETMGLLRAAGEAARPWLLEAVADPDDGVARTAVRLCGRGEMPTELALPVLIRALARPGVCGQALQELATHGPEALPALREAAADADPKVRGQVMTALRSVGEDGVGLLVAGLADEDESVRQYAAAALMNMGPQAASAVPALAELVVTAPASVKVAAARALDRIGAEPAWPTLEKLADDEDSERRMAVATAVARLAATSEPAWKVLRRDLADRDSRVRWSAAMAFQIAGADAVRRARPELRTLFAEGDRTECDAAAAALRLLRDEAAADFAAYFGDPQEFRRRIARKELARIGAAGVAALLAVADEGDEEDRRGVAETLVNMGPPGVEGLTKLLGHAAPDARRYGAWGLGKVGPAARGAVPDLILALGDADTHVVAQAAWALGQMGPAAHDAVPALEKLRQARVHREIVDDALRRIRGD